jgi:hypothetical protein
MNTSSAGNRTISTLPTAAAGVGESPDIARADANLPAGEPLGRGEASDELLKQRILYTNDIIDTMFSTYHWLTLKVQALMAITAALIAATAFVLKDLPNLLWWEKSIGGLGVLCLFSALGFCLHYLVPLYNARIGNENNLRTIIGIVPIHKDDYQRRIEELTLRDMLKYNANQISGMSLLCKVGRARVQRSVIAIAVGAFFLGVSIGSWSVRTSIDAAVAALTKPPNTSTVSRTQKVRAPTTKGRKQ